MQFEIMVELFFSVAAFIAVFSTTKMQEGWGRLLPDVRKSST